MNQTHKIKLTPRKFEDLSSLKYSLFTCPLITWPDKQGMLCLVVEFGGECGQGTQDHGYADLMSAIIKASVDAWRPMALIMDLRPLKYRWGDEMTKPFRACAPFQALSLKFGSICEEYPNLVESDLSRITNESLAFPMAVVVSELNRTGLTSLVKVELPRELGKEMNPDDFLFETLEDALEAVDRQLQKIFQKMKP